MNEEIELFVKNYFTNHKADSAWALVSIIKEKYNLNVSSAYNYVSKYLSRKWEV